MFDKKLNLFGSDAANSKRNFIALSQFNDNDKNFKKARLEITQPRFINIEKNSYKANYKIKLLHLWEVKIGKLKGSFDNYCIYYSPELNQKISIYYENGFDINKLVHEYELYNISYFKENQLIAFLKKIANGITNVKKIPGCTIEKLITICNFYIAFEDLFSKGVELKTFFSISNNKLNSILKNLFNLEIILKKGVEPNQLFEVDESRLEAIANTVNLYDVLKFLTIEQILGLSNKSKDFSNYNLISVSGNHTFIGAGEESMKLDSKTITSNLNNNILNIKSYDKKTKLTHTCKVKSLPNLYNIEQIIDYNTYELTHIQLLDLWQKFVKEENNSIHIILYCPTSKDCFEFEMDKNFPEDSLEHISDMKPLSFYKENRFVYKLLEQGVFIDFLIQSLGVSKSKLRHICKYNNTWNDMKNDGLNFEKIALMDENRFAFLISNYIFAEFTLNFVTMDELCGIIPTETNKYHPSFEIAKLDKFVSREKSRKLQRL